MLPLALALLARLQGCITMRAMRLLRFELGLQLSIAIEPRPVGPIAGAHSAARAGVLSHRKPRTHDRYSCA